MATRAQSRPKEVSLSRYEAALQTAAHFRSKSSNSNAELALIRCAPDEALDLPYISLRCLLGGDRDIPLDSGVGSNAAASLVRQCIGAATNAPETEGQFTAIERRMCADVLDECRSKGMEDGTNYIDHRLCRVLLPAPDGVDADDNTVCVTPLTSTSVVSMMLAWETGAVAEHDAAVKAQRDAARSGEGEGVQLRRLQRAHMPYGGANPINVSRFTSTLHRPLMLGCPSPKQSARNAWRLYWHGVDLKGDAGFRLAVRDYARFLRTVRFLHEERDLPWTMQHRLQERRLLSSVAQKALDAGAQALAMLRASSASLPKHKRFVDGQPHLVSPMLPEWQRGLIDPRLREDAWGLLVATHIEKTMRALLPPMSQIARGAVVQIISRELS